MASAPSLTIKATCSKPRVNSRVKRAQELLGMLKIEPGRVEILSSASATDGESLCVEFSGRVKQLGLRGK